MTALAYPKYGTETVVSVDSPLITVEKKTFKCCWNGHKASRTHCPCYLHIFALFAVSTGVSVWTGYWIQGCVQMKSSDGNGLQIFWTVIFGCFSAVFWGATAKACYQECASASSEDDTPSNP